MITFTFTCLLSSPRVPGFITIYYKYHWHRHSLDSDLGPGLMTLFKSYHEHGDFISSFLDKLYKFPIITASGAAVIFWAQYIIFVSEIMSLPSRSWSTAVPHLYHSENLWLPLCLWPIAVLSLKFSLFYTPPLPLTQFRLQQAPYILQWHNSVISHWL